MIRFTNLIMTYLNLKFRFRIKYRYVRNRLLKPRIMMSKFLTNYNRSLLYIMIITGFRDRIC